MSITLNGTTGITTPDIDSAAAPDFDGSNITGVLKPALAGVTSVDDTTVATLAAAGVGESAIGLDSNGNPTLASTVSDVEILDLVGAQRKGVGPNVPVWESPVHNFLSSGTYSRGSTPADQKVWLYGINGGGGGGSSSGGGAGGFFFIVTTAGAIDGRSYTIGAGGQPQNGAGGLTTIDIDGTTYGTADAGNTLLILSGAKPIGVESSSVRRVSYNYPSLFSLSIDNTMTVADSGLTNPDGSTISGSNLSVFSGGSGGPYVHYDGSASNEGYGKPSIYGGKGGDSNAYHSNYGRTATVGQQPGGGGGQNLAGGAGSLRIYHID